MRPARHKSARSHRSDSRRPDRLYAFDSKLRSTGRARWIAHAATAPSAARSRKKLVFDKLDQKLPIQPAAIFPTKLVVNQIPINVERDLLDATFDTSERPIGEK